jgi:hypothetical protein
MNQAMSTDRRQSNRLRDLEGRRVNLALADGSSFTGVTLVSSGRGTVSSLWLDVDGMDVFIHRTQVLNAWEPRVGAAA